MIRRDGALEQFVSCNERAWHAGPSNFFGRERCNDFSIGIELEGSDTTPSTRRNTRTLGALGECAEGRAIRSTRSRVIRTLRPGRKTDPGPAFRVDASAVATRASPLGIFPISSLPRRRNAPCFATSRKRDRDARRCLVLQRAGALLPPKPKVNPRRANKTYLSLSRIVHYTWCADSVTALDLVFAVHNRA